MPDEAGVRQDGFSPQSTGFQVLAILPGKLIPHFGLPCSVGMNGCTFFRALPYSFRPGASASSIFLKEVGYKFETVVKDDVMTLVFETVTE